MQSLRQAAAGMLGGLLSAIIVLGSITLALAEGGIPRALAPSQPAATTPPPLPTPLPGQPTYTASPTSLPTATPTASISAFGPTPTTCPVPPGWIVIQTGTGETLADIAAAYGTSVEILIKGNCLVSYQLPPNVYLSVPVILPTATSTVAATATRVRPPTKTPVVCTPSIPSTWVRYIIRSGDTLSSIARAHGTTWQELYQRNCLTSTTIRTGEVIYVPAVATRTPTLPPTFTPTVPPTTVIITVVVPSSTPTSTWTATATATATTAPTATATPTPTNTPLPSPTTVPTDTPPPPTETPRPSEPNSASPDQSLIFYLAL